jgi:hypothetical protein
MNIPDDAHSWLRALSEASGVPMSRIMALFLARAKAEGWSVEHTAPRIREPETP